MHRHISFLLVFIFVLLPAPVARAQQRDVLPAINIDSRIPADELDELIKLPKFYDEYGFQNEYLREYSSLQYQINLIEQLIRRQANIVRMEKIYAEMGIPYTPPKLPEEICKKLPENVLCDSNYISFWDALAQVNKVNGADGDLVQQARVTIPEPADEKKEADKPKEPAVTWAEINCTGNACTAVITVDENSNQRRTVRQGDKLDDGSVISGISFYGVKIEKGGQETALMPSKASSKGGSSSPVMKIFSSVEKTIADREPEPDTEEP